jgi:hypothetical protein
VTPRRPRTAGFAALAVLLVATTVASCEVAVAGGRCAGGVARDAGYVLVCRNGRWRRSITLAEAGRIIGQRIAADRAAAAAKPPTPPTAPTAAGGATPETTLPTTTVPTTIPSTTTTVPAPTQTVLAVGDIARCGGDHAAVADVLRTQSGPFLALGDEIQGDDPDSEYPQCYDPVFGQFLDRTFPAPGNHEYLNGSPPRAYLSYFGDRATPHGTTWYSFDVGNWHVVSLNSNCSERDVGGCGTSSAQYRWLAADLAASTTPCLLAYWHHSPFYSMTPYTPETQLVPMMALLHREGLDVLLGGHLHNYERFARMDEDGTPDPTGFRAFVVGTGGASHFAQSAPRPGSEARNDSTFGLLRLDLSSSGYRWNFLPVAGGRFTDSGSDTC